MFNVDLETMEITMHRGDTGSFKIGAFREDGTAWTENDRMLFTVKNVQGEVVMQRIYRLDDQYSLGNGKVLIEFHNDDTDEMDFGIYTTELRFIVDAIWDNETVPTARCMDALATGTPKIVDGSIVRTTLQSKLTINGILGEI